MEVEVVNGMEALESSYGHDRPVVSTLHCGEYLSCPDALRCLLEGIKLSGFLHLFCSGFEVG